MRFIDLEHLKSLLLFFKIYFSPLDYKSMSSRASHGQVTQNPRHVMSHLGEHSVESLGPTLDP